MLLNIYGPFLSRRLGLSLGIDLLAQFKYKLCTFNCVYCEIGFTRPEYYCPVHKRILIDNKLINHIETQLSKILLDEHNLESITIGYNGEPTLVQNLDIIVEKIKKIRYNFKLNTPISIFTNSSTILDKNVCKNLSKIDNIIFKLDAATDKIFKIINKPHYTVPKISEIIEGIKNFKEKFCKTKLIIQTMLIKGNYANITLENLKNLAEAYQTIQPDHIQLYSISRSPADPSVRRLSIDELIEIKNKIQNYLKDKNINIQTYW